MFDLPYSYSRFIGIMRKFNQERTQIFLFEILQNIIFFLLILLRIALIDNSFMQPEKLLLKFKCKEIE